MLSNLLAFGELKVSDIMVPRAEIVAADETLPLPELVTLFRAAQHSRLPVYRETLDDATGLVHVKDVMALLELRPDGDYRLAELPPSPPRSSGRCCSCRLRCAPSTCLLKMQTSHTHLALVIDEYGGTDGLVSIENIIEEIVGDIADDEHDDDGMVCCAATALVIVVDARLDHGRLQAPKPASIFPPPKPIPKDVDSAGRAGDLAAGPRAPAGGNHHPSLRL